MNMKDADVLKNLADGVSLPVPTGWWLRRYRNLEHRGLITISAGEKDDLDGDMWNVEMTVAGRTLLQAASAAEANGGKSEYVSS